MVRRIGKTKIKWSVWKVFVEVYCCIVELRTNIDKAGPLQKHKHGNSVNTMTILSCNESKSGSKSCISGKLSKLIIPNLLTYY